MSINITRQSFSYNPISTRRFLTPRSTSLSVNHTALYTRKPVNLTSLPPPTHSLVSYSFPNRRKIQLLSRGGVPLSADRSSDKVNNFMEARARVHISLSWGARSDLSDTAHQLLLTRKRRNTSERAGEFIASACFAKIINQGKRRLQLTLLLRCAPTPSFFLFSIFIPPRSETNFEFR